MLKEYMITKSPCHQLEATIYSCMLPLVCNRTKSDALASRIKGLIESTWIRIGADVNAHLIFQMP